MNDLDKIQKALGEVGINFHTENSKLMNNTPVISIVIDKKSMLPSYDEDGDLLIPYIIFDKDGKFIRIEIGGE